VHLITAPNYGPFFPHITQPMLNLLKSSLFILTGVLGVTYGPGIHIEQLWWTQW